MIASQRYETAVIIRGRCGWVKFSDCGELLCGFPLKLKGALYKRCITPVILYGNEAWFLK